MDARMELVEAIDRIDCDGASWLQVMLEAMGRRLEPGGPLIAFSSELDATGTARYRDVATLRDEVARLAPVLEAARLATTDEDVQRMFYNAPARHSLTTLTSRQLRSATSTRGLTEVVGINCPTGTGRAIVLGAASPSPCVPTDRERRYWSPLAEHLARMARLRDRLSARREEPEAILEPGGCLLHARHEARERGLRDVLRAVVRARERSRSRAKAGPFWPGLVAGRWTLVDRYESEGRRTVVAYRNDGSARRLRALSSLERQVVVAAASGVANKAIAIDLARSEATVSRALDRGLRKLGANLAEVEWLQSTTARSMNLSGTSLATATATCSVLPLERLSSTERQVASLALRGWTAHEIAHVRGRSPRTIINQLASIYAKLGVASRRELVLAAAPR